MKWYYRSEGEEVGPISEFDLHKRANRGVIKPDDLVWKKSFGKEWIPAAKVPGLIEKVKEADQPNLKLAARPRATIREQVKSIRVLLKKNPASWLAGQIRRLSRGKVFKVSKKQRIKKQAFPFLLLMTILFVLSYYLFVHQSGGLSRIFMGVGSKVGVDMTGPAVCARALSFGTALVNLRKKNPEDGRKHLMDFIAPGSGQTSYINRLWEEYGNMTPEYCAVSAFIQNADYSAENQRAIIIISLSISTDGHRTNRPMRTEWRTIGNNWVCIP